MYINYKRKSEQCVFNYTRSQANLNAVKYCYLLLDVCGVLVTPLRNMEIKAKSTKRAPTDMTSPDFLPFKKGFGDCRAITNTTTLITVYMDERIEIPVTDFIGTRKYIRQVHAAAIGLSAATETSKAEMFR